MKPKNLSKKIRRLEARLQKGAKKLAKLKQKLEAVTKAGVAKKKRKSAARAAETRKRANTSGRTEKKKRRLTPTQTRLRAANRPSAERNGKKKRNLTPERRAQLAAAMKARWAAKRAAVDANKIRHFKPPPLDENVLAEHKQLSLYSCIPMAVEFVLKLWKNSRAKISVFKRRGTTGKRVVFLTSMDGNSTTSNSLGGFPNHVMTAFPLMACFLQSRTNWHLEGT
jgi:hypothetical protein